MDIRTHKFATHLPDNGFIIYDITLVTSPVYTKYLMGT